MLAKIKAFFSDQMALDDGAADPEHRLQLAAAALLIELAKADYDRHSSEEAAIKQALQATFSLNDTELNALLELAETETREATSLYQFTRLINDHYDDGEKYRLIELLWQVAAADGEISKYEDHLIRKIAELIYVSHKDFIRAKLRVLQD